MKESTIPKIQFRDRLIDWSQANLGVKFDSLNNAQRSRQMIRFFVLEVLRSCYPAFFQTMKENWTVALLTGWATAEPILFIDRMKASSHNPGKIPRE